MVGRTPHPPPHRLCTKDPGKSRGLVIKWKRGHSYMAFESREGEPRVEAVCPAGPLIVGEVQAVPECPTVIDEG